MKIALPRTRTLTRVLFRANNLIEDQHHYRAGRSREGIPDVAQPQVVAHRNNSGLAASAFPDAGAAHF